MGYRTDILALANIKGYLELDETSGTNAVDDAGAGADGTYAGTFTLNATPGPINDGVDTGGWVDLNGTTGTVTFPDHADRDLGDASQTVMLWFMHDGAGTTEEVLVDKGSGAYALILNSGNHAGKLGLVKSGTSILVESTGTVSNSVKHMAAYTKNGAAVKLYLDGVDVTGAVTNATFVDTADLLYIGKDHSSGGFFNGKIGRVAIVKGTVLTAAEIAAFYATGIGTQSITLGTAPLTLTGPAPTIASSTPTVVLGTAPLTLTAPAPTLSAGPVTITLGIATLTLTGLAPTLSLTSPAIILGTAPLSLSAPFLIMSAGPGIIIGRPVEYVVELFADDASFGPGTKLAEVWDGRNVGWSTYDRIPGKGFMTLAQTSSLLPLFVPLETHVKIWRISSIGEKNVFSGPYIDYSSTGDDVVLDFFDYKALLATSRAGFKTLYPAKKLGTEIVSPEWVLAKTTTPNSPLAFVTTGTIEDPLGNDAVTTIKTSAGFGTLDQQRLQLFYDLSEIGRANTPNHVTFDISRTSPHTFSFLKNRGVSSGIAFVLGGNVSDYGYLPNWSRYRNDLASVGMNAAGGPAEIVKKDDAAAAVKGRRQDVYTIQTLLGIVGAATEADQQQAALQRALRNTLTLQPALQLRLVRGAHETFDGYDISDKVLIEIGNGIETLTGEWRLIGEVGLMREDGEVQSVIVAPVAT